MSCFIGFLKCDLDDKLKRTQTKTNIRLQVCHKIIFLTELTKLSAESILRTGQMKMARKGQNTWTHGPITLKNCSSSCKRNALMVFRKQKWHNVLQQLLVSLCETLSQKEIRNFWDKDFDLEEDFVRNFRLTFLDFELSLNFAPVFSKHKLQKTTLP